MSYSLLWEDWRCPARVWGLGSIKSKRTNFLFLSFPFLSHSLPDRVVQYALLHWSKVAYYRCESRARTTANTGIAALSQLAKPSAPSHRIVGGFCYACLVSRFPVKLSFYHFHCSLFLGPHVESWRYIRPPSISLVSSQRISILSPACMCPPTKTSQDTPVGEWRFL